MEVVLVYPVSQVTSTDCPVVPVMESFVALDEWETSVLAQATGLHVIEVNVPLLWHCTLLPVVLLVYPVSQITSTDCPVVPVIESCVALFEWET